MNKGMLPMMQSPSGMIMMPMMRSSNVANLFNIINKQQRGQGSSHNHTFSSAGDHDAHDAVFKRGESFQHYQQATARPRLFSQPQILLSRHQST
jgi:hypothetical protein